MKVSVLYLWLIAGGVWYTALRGSAKVYGVAASGISLLTPHYVVREFVVFVVDTILGNYQIEKYHPFMTADLPFVTMASRSFLYSPIYI